MSHAQISPLTYAYLVRYDINADYPLGVGGIERPNLVLSWNRFQQMSMTRRVHIAKGLLQINIRFQTGKLSLSVTMRKGCSLCLKVAFIGVICGSESERLYSTADLSKHIILSVESE